MRIAAKMMAGALLAGAVLAAPAQAQINYSTTGQFTSASSTCNSLVPTTVAVCTGGGFSLTFTGTDVNPINYANGSAAFLGSFLLAPLPGVPSSTVTVAPGAVMFNLAINQVLPTGGTGNAVGNFTGTVTYNGSTGFSSLVFSPNQVVTINGTTYTLIFDAGPDVTYNGIKVSLDVNQPTSVKAIVNTPEPASMGLLATGLLGIFGIGRRRKSA
jgi:hypothetical protein